MTPHPIRTAAALGALAALAACAAPTAAAPPPPAAGHSTPAGGARYQVVTEPDDGMTGLYRLLDSATTSVELSMYELVDQRAETILAAGAARGVHERVVLDHNREGAANAAAYSYLTTHGVAVHWAPAGFAASHQKTAIIDRRIAAVMTLNLTARYYPNSRDFAVVDTDPADVAAIAQVFDADFAGVLIDPPPDPALVWSPGSEAPVVALINSARSSVAVETEEMVDRPVVDALAAGAHRGIIVTVTMTDSPTWAPAFATLAAAGVRIHVYHGETPIYIHAKAVVVDAGGSGQRALIGSENFTVASLSHNRELGVIIDTPAPVGSVAAMLARDFAGATPWRRP